MTTPAAVAVALIVEALENAQALAHDDPPARDLYTRALTATRESGVLITAEGQPVADLLDAFYDAMPTPKATKASEVWSVVARQYHRPRYRFHSWMEGARLMDTQTGQLRIWRDDTGAPAMRAAFAQTDSGAPVTQGGIGVCGLHEELAAELLREKVNR